jgi:cytochrome d ubiquinol oxidase subunit II
MNSSISKSSGSSGGSCLGVLLIGFAMTDGFDMGVGALLPFVGRNDVERRVAINTVGPVWEGNQVWFILGGGAIFAAWPPLYAVSFSGFYLAMFAVLAALILRPVAFKYRSKRDSAAWRSGWDWALFVGGAVPALIFGVAVGNVLQGVPFNLTRISIRSTPARSHPSSSAFLTRSHC